MTAHPPPGPWADFAACLGVDPDLFFPERGENTAPAKRVCTGCVVRSECLEYALRYGEKFGIWGGTSERERRRIRKRRGAAPKPRPVTLRAGRAPVPLDLQQQAARAALEAGDRLPPRPGAGHVFDGLDRDPDTGRMLPRVDA